MRETKNQKNIAINEIFDNKINNKFAYFGNNANTNEYGFNSTLNHVYNFQNNSDKGIGKRVKRNQGTFGQNSEVNDLEEGEEDAEGKKYFIKRAKFTDRFNVNDDMFKFDTFEDREKFRRGTMREEKQFTTTEAIFINNINRELNNYNNEAEAFDFVVGNNRNDFGDTETKSTATATDSVNTTPEMASFGINFRETEPTFANNESFFPEFSTKKRDAKFEAKGKFTCVACKLQFTQIKFDKFCHNCFKIFEEVAVFIDKKEATFEFTDRNNEIKIICKNGHTFKTEYKLKM